jgi:hypothetical protein
MTFGGQQPAQFGRVVNFAIEGYPYGAVLVGQRLAPGFAQIHDAEATVA